MPLLPFPDGESRADEYRGDVVTQPQSWVQRLQGDLSDAAQPRSGVSGVGHDGNTGSDNGDAGGHGNASQANAGGEGANGTKTMGAPSNAGAGVDINDGRVNDGPGRPAEEDASQVQGTEAGSTERPNVGIASVDGLTQVGTSSLRQSDEETEEADVDVLAVEGRAQKRYKRSEKIDVEDPNTWTKGQLRCALSACGMPSVCRIKAAGRDGQQQLARLVSQFWGSPRKKLLSQQAAVGMAGEGFDPGPLAAAWSAAAAGLEARSGSTGGGTGLTGVELPEQRPSGERWKILPCIRCLFWGLWASYSFCRSCSCALKHARAHGVKSWFGPHA